MFLLNLGRLGGLIKYQRVILCVELLIPRGQCLAACVSGTAVVGP